MKAAFWMLFDWIEQPRPISHVNYGFKRSDRKPTASNSCESGKNIPLQQRKDRKQPAPGKQVGPTRPLSHIILIAAVALIIAADEPLSGDRTQTREVCALLVRVFPLSSALRVFPILQPRYLRRPSGALFVQLSTSLPRSIFRPLHN